MRVLAMAVIGVSVVSRKHVTSLSGLSTVTLSWLTQ
jgi:hypothetical protein